MSKQKVSAKAVVADIKSGLSDDELMKKYNLTSKGLESLFDKLVEKNVMTSAEIVNRGQDRSKSSESESSPGAAPQPPGAAKSDIDRALAEAVVDLIRKGTHKNELMVKFGMSPSQLENLLEGLVRLGYLSAEERDLGRPRKTRQCPHCSGAVPEEEEQCPHCGQYPDLPPDAQQHLAPDAQDTGIHPPDVSEERYCAWEDRRNQGTVAGYIQTASRCLLSPADFFSKLPLDSGYLSPILFSAMSIVVAVLFNVLWFQLFKGGPGAFGLIGLIFLLSITFVIAVISIPIGLLVWSLFVHGMLMLLKGAQSGFQTTFRVACYSSVTSIFSSIPVIGAIASLWGLYLSVVGLRETHETTTGKAAGAVLTPFSILVVAGLLSWGLFPFSGAGAKAGHGYQGTSPAQQEGAASPAGICAAIETFAERVDAAAASGTVKDAQAEVKKAFEDLDINLKGLADLPRANRIRQKAVAFAVTHINIMAFKEKFGRSGVPELERKLGEMRASLTAECTN